MPARTSRPRGSPHPPPQGAAETGAGVWEGSTLPIASAPVGRRPSAPGWALRRERGRAPPAKVNLSCPCLPVLLAPDPTHWRSARGATLPRWAPYWAQPGPGVQGGGGGSPRGPHAAGPGCKPWWSKGAPGLASHCGHLLAGEVTPRDKGSAQQHCQVLLKFPQNVFNSGRVARVRPAETRRPLPSRPPSSAGRGLSLKVGFPSTDRQPVGGFGKPSECSCWIIPSGGSPDRRPAPSGASQAAPEQGPTGGGGREGGGSSNVSGFGGIHEPLRTNSLRGRRGLGREVLRAGSGRLRPPARIFLKPRGPRPASLVPGAGSTRTE